MPKREVDYIFDLADDELASMHVFAKKVALAIQKSFPCKKVGEAVIGLEVPHAHIHLIPIQKESDMIFSNPKLKLANEEFVEIARTINEAWALAMYHQSYFENQQFLYTSPASFPHLLFSILLQYNA